ncbi:MAG: hypothetical protein CMM60_10165 [Rhodospirillaceae bacterium]|jgi:Bax protein|nr:hypothetical protein [Rhodospirillaceae bacterium]|tara:strand:- start:272 stop:1372 length:1101 start_codon:yes stop_codon:yes gene_type:complete
MTIRFERGALIAVAGLVAGLIAVVILSPLEKATVAPKASLRLTVSQPVPAPVFSPVFTHPAEDVMLVLAPSARGRNKPVISPRMAGIDTLTGFMSVDDVDRTSRERSLKTTQALSETFNQLGYDLDLVRSGKANVPRLFLASLPGDLKDIRETRVRKTLFFKTVLPLILQINEEILRDRRRLWRLHFQRGLGLKFGPADRLWLMVMAERYNLKNATIDNLLKRVDIVPPSLALAQAAEESGWGTSRFVREGNAVFGQWTFSDTGNLLPARRDEDKTHKIRAFPSLLESVRAYARNLNTHPAYRQMRRIRDGFRIKGAPLEGLLMVGDLKNYSVRGEKYVETIKTLIEANNLQRFDDARLGDEGPLI